MHNQLQDAKQEWTLQFMQINDRGMESRLSHKMEIQGDSIVNNDYNWFMEYIFSSSSCNLYG